MLLSFIPLTLVVASDRDSSLVSITLTCSTLAPIGWVSEELGLQLSQGSARPGKEIEELRAWAVRTDPGVSIRGRASRGCWGRVLGTEDEAEADPHCVWVTESLWTISQMSTWRGGLKTAELFSGDSCRCRGSEELSKYRGHRGNTRERLPGWLRPRLRQQVEEIEVNHLQDQTGYSILAPDIEFNITTSKGDKGTMASGGEQRVTLDQWQ